MHQKTLVTPLVTTDKQAFEWRKFAELDRREWNLSISKALLRKTHQRRFCDGVVIFLSMKRLG